MIEDECTYDRAEAMELVHEALTGVCQHVRPPRPEGPVNMEEIEHDAFLNHAMALADATAALKRCAPHNSKARQVLVRHPRTDAEARLRAATEDLIVSAMNGDLKGMNERE